MLVYFVLFFSALYAIFYFKKQVMPVKLIFDESNPTSKQIVNNMKILHEKYLPIPIVSISGVFHSIIGIILPLGRLGSVKFSVQELKTKDNGLLSLVWIGEKKEKKILLLPGFEGGSASTYISRFARICVETNEFQVVVLNFRGYNNQPVRSPRYHDLGNTDDLDFGKL